MITMYFCCMTINCNGNLLDVASPVVMGILNITPDSFYRGSRFQGVKEAVSQAKNMIEDGATILDLGAMSSRPGASVISAEEEVKRILPIVKAIIKELPEAIISIDTAQSQVAKICLDEGVHMINDVSGSKMDEQLVRTVAQYNVPYVLMHMRGTSDTMQTLTQYDDVTMEVLAYMSNHIRNLRELGISDVIVDPGFGFAKLDEHNFQLMKQFSSFQIFDCPLLAGISRKSTIQRTLDVTAESALNGTTALHMYLLSHGVNILRVHDVKEAVEVIKLWSAIHI